MPYEPSDIYRVIEPLFITQGFGANPASYARFGLKGHNGWDYRTKVSEDTKLANNRIIPATPTGKRPLLAPWLVELYKKGWDPGGFGNYFEVIVRLYSTWKITYGHCTSIGDWKTRTEAQDMAISGSTGNSTADHVHETCKRIKIVNGAHQVLDYNNGYFGAVNNQEFYDELRRWKKEKGADPQVEISEGESMSNYKGYDLSNEASMRVAVDVLLEVLNGTYVKKTDHEKKLEELRAALTNEKNNAVEDAFRRGVTTGKAEPRVPTDNGQVSGPNVPQNFKMIEVTEEKTEGNTKVTKKYVA